MYISKDQLRLAKVIDMYVIKRLNRKQVNVYFKLAFPTIGRTSKVVDITLPVPSIDVSLGKVYKGATLILAEVGMDKYVYLGRNDDFDVLASVYNIDPKDSVALTAKFDFSEGVAEAEEKVIEHPGKVVIVSGGKQIASANVDRNSGKLSGCRYDGDFGMNALRNYSSPRGYVVSKDKFLRGV